MINPSVVSAMFVVIFVWWLVLHVVTVSRMRMRGASLAFVALCVLVILIGCFDSLRLATTAPMQFVDYTKMMIVFRILLVPSFFAFSFMLVPRGARTRSTSIVWLVSCLLLALIGVWLAGAGDSVVAGVGRRAVGPYFRPGRAYPFVVLYHFAYSGQAWRCLLFAYRTSEAPVTRRGLWSLRIAGAVAVLSVLFGALAVYWSPVTPSFQFAPVVSHIVLCCILLVLGYLVIRHNTRMPGRVLNRGLLYSGFVGLGTGLTISGTAIVYRWLADSPRFPGMAGLSLLVVMSILPIMLQPFSLNIRLGISKVTTPNLTDRFAYARRIADRLIDRQDLTTILRGSLNNICWHLDAPWGAIEIYDKDVMGERWVGTYPETLEAGKGDCFSLPEDEAPSFPLFVGANRVGTLHLGRTSEPPHSLAQPPVPLQEMLDNMSGALGWYWLQEQHFGQKVLSRVEQLSDRALSTAAESRGAIASPYELPRYSIASAEDPGFFEDSRQLVRAQQKRKRGGGWGDSPLIGLRQVAHKLSMEPELMPAEALEVVVREAVEGTRPWGMRPRAKAAATNLAWIYYSILTMCLFERCDDGVIMRRLGYEDPRAKTPPDVELIFDRPPPRNSRASYYRRKEESIFELMACIYNRESVMKLMRRGGNA